jgi:hypothetical protein
MIRPFDWRDLSLLHRLREEALCLDAQQSFTRGHHPLQSTLLGALSPTATTQTLVARPAGPDEPAALAQFLHRNGEALARLTYFSPAEGLTCASGQALLEALCAAAGHKGALNLIAEVDEECPAFVGMRQAGFAIYARQSIWRWAGQQSDGVSLQPDKAAPPLWRAETPTDRAAIHFLYASLVPALVQQIEIPLPSGTRGLVHRQQGELLGYLAIARGPLGAWVEPYFHPATERAHALIAEFLARGPLTPGRPVYLCVRSYQGWLNGLLARLDFELCSSQAVMVKRLAATVHRPALAPLPALEGKRPEATTPFARAGATTPMHKPGRPR